MTRSHRIEKAEVVCIHLWERGNDVRFMGHPERKMCYRCGIIWDPAVLAEEPRVVVARIEA